jgi:hypothetical protein
VSLSERLVGADPAITKLSKALGALQWDPPGVATLRLVNSQFPPGTRERVVAAAPAVKELVTYLQKNLDGTAIKIARSVLKSVGRDNPAIDNAQEMLRALIMAMSHPQFAGRVYDQFPSIIATYEKGSVLEALFDPRLQRLVNEARKAGLWTS